MTSHVLFLTIHALTMEMCALLPLDTQFLSESFPRFAASFPSLLATTSRLLVLGTYGETTLLATNCLLNSDDASMQLGSAQWQSSSHLGPISHEESMGGESVESESLMHGIASGWGSSMIGYGTSSSKVGHARGVLSETEQEIAVIESMLWTAPIIADASGKGSKMNGESKTNNSVGGVVGVGSGAGGHSNGSENNSSSPMSSSPNSANTAEFPRREQLFSLPCDVQPAPAVLERLVDAAISLFGRIFPYQNSHQRHRLLTQLIGALKESQPNKQQADGSDLSYATVASKSARNIVAALLCTVRHLQNGDPALISRGPGERTTNSGDADTNIMTLIPDASKPGKDMGSSSGSLDLPWLMTFRAILKSALSPNDVLVRRASGTAMGCLTSIVGGMFSRKVLRSLVVGIKGKSPSSPSQRAGTAFALACHYRHRLRTQNGSANELPELDAILYDLARETREPVRTSALHSWWILLRGQTMHTDANRMAGGGSGSGLGSGKGNDGAGGSGLRRYIKPTLALVEAHLLAPALGMSRKGDVGTVDSLDHLTFPDKDMTVVARHVQTGVLHIMGRLVNAIVSGLGSGLKSWLKEGGNTSKKQLSLMWATWIMLRRSPEEIVMIEAMHFIHLLATHYPKLLFHDTRFATLVVPWLDGVL